MSYLKDPDRKTRGVGAIASRDAMRSTRFRGRARAMGGDPPPQACAQFEGGAWYLRYRDGRNVKVSAAEAAQHPSCGPAQPSPVHPGGAVRPKLSGRSTAVTTTVGRPGVVTVRPGTGMPPSTPLTPPGPAVQPPVQPTATPPLPPKSHDGISKFPGRPRGTSRDGTVQVPPAPTPGPKITGGTTAPQVVSSPSVVSHWTSPPFVPPPSPAPSSSPVDAEIDAEIEVSAPSPAAPRKVSGLAVAAGIGLLLLLARD